MLGALWEVIVELAGFAFRRRSPVKQLAAPVPVRALPSPERTVPAMPVPVASPAAHPSGAPTAASGRPLGAASCFVCTETCAVHLRPARVLDGVLGTLACGSEVAVVGYQGRWVEIRFGTGTAWVSKENLTDDRAAVFPVLEEGVVYDSSHPDTERIRRVIGDVFAARDLNLPLLGIEYVTYQLERDGRRVSWPTDRPRSAGRWRELLRGVRGVHLSVQPTTRCIMEVLDERGLGSVSYVESVRPDESIVVATVGRYVDGRFARLTLVKAAWQALRPVFIEVR